MSMIDVHSYTFMAALHPGDIVIQPYGHGYSSARFNGSYYDTFQQWTYNPFQENEHYTRRFAGGNVEVYTRIEKTK